jgi:2'-5' RNA ligase
MKLTNIVRHILLEKKGDSYDTGAVMLYFHSPEVIKEIHDKIDKADLYTEEGDRTYGIEDEPHITLLYGIKAGIPLENIVEVTDEFTYGPCKISNASIFENEKYDVLKFDVSGDNIHETNEALTEAVPYKNDYPDYHPHLTIAYVKPGIGKKYTKLFEDKEFKLIPKNVVYSKADGTKDDIQIEIINSYDTI